MELCKDLFVVIMILTWSSVCKLLLVAVTSWVVQGMRSSRLIDIVNQKDDYFLRETYVDHDYIDEEIYQDVKEETIRQILDHFRLEDERTFHQRYFYTDRYVNPAAAREYAFLCVGGEGPALTKAVLVDSVHCTGDMIETARRLYEKGNVSIHLYALEHRYYGKSYPTFHSVNEDSASSSPVTNKHLVYLSSYVLSSTSISYPLFEGLSHGILVMLFWLLHLLPQSTSAS